MNEKRINELQQFRVELYHTFSQRADAVYELIDTLAGEPDVRSPAELSLSPLFRRQYGSIYDGVDDWQYDQAALEQWLLSLAPTPAPGQFRVVGVDHTAKARPYAKTVSDRGFVHQPTVIKGNKPVTIGHSYSVLGQIDLGERQPWLAVFNITRIPTQTTPLLTGLSQMMQLACRCDDWLVCTGDCEYGQALSVACLDQCPQVSGLFRLRGNRKLYGPPPPYAGRGRPREHGDLFRLNDESTWWSPLEEVSWPEQDERGRVWTIRLRRWSHLHFTQAPHHEFDLVQAQVTDEAGQPRFRHPWWLLACGQRPLPLRDCWLIYSRRPVLEHYFRFNKQQLLFTAAQMGTTPHEEKFVLVNTLAYAQLYLARHDIEPIVRPWERYKPAPTAGQAVSPAQARRGFARLLLRLGSPARPPKPRGKSPGRTRGYHPPLRPRYPVVKKRLSPTAVAV